MKIKDLIAQLSTLNPDAVVEIYCPDAEEYLPVSGIVHDFATGETQLFADGDVYMDAEREYEDEDEDE